MLQSRRQSPAPRTHAPQQTAMTATLGHNSTASQQDAAPSAQLLRAAHTSRAGRSPHSLTSAVVLASSPKLSHRPGSALPQPARTPRQQHLPTAPDTLDLKASVVRPGLKSTSLRKPTRHRCMSPDACTSTEKLQRIKLQPVNSALTAVLLAQGCPPGPAANSMQTQPSSASPQSMSAQPSQTAPEQRGEEPESTADLLQQLSSVRLPSGLGPEAADEPITPTSMHQLLHRISEVQGLPRSSRPSAERTEHAAQPPRAAVLGEHTHSPPARSSRQSSSFKARQLQRASSDRDQEVQISHSPAASGDLDLTSSDQLEPMTPISVHALVQRIEFEVQGSSRPSRASEGSSPARLAPEDVHQLLQRIDSQAAASTRSARTSAGSLQPPSAAPMESRKLDPGHSSTRPTQEDPTLPAEALQPHVSARPAASSGTTPASSPSPAARPASPSLSQSSANRAPARSTSPSPQQAPEDTADPARSVHMAQGSEAIAPQAPQAESSPHQLLREISQELQLSQQGPDAGTPEAAAAAAAGETAAEPRESTEQLLQRINSALQGEPSGSAAEPAELGDDPQVHHADVLGPVEDSTDAGTFALPQLLAIKAFLPH